MTIIYLDNASATRPLEFKEELFWQSIEAPYAPKEARLQYHRALGAIKSELSYGERDALFLTGDGKEAVRRLASLHYEIVCVSGRGHILHLPGSLLPSAFSSGACECIPLPIASDEQITPEFLEPYLKPRVSLLSIELAHPLTGVIHPIWDIAALCKKKGVLLHIDVTSSIGKLSTRFDELPADYLTADGRLIGAPAECGFLLARECSVQETAGYQRAVALAEALSTASARFERMNLETVRLRSRFEQAVKERILGERLDRLPHVTAIQFQGIHHELLLFHLVQKGVIAAYADHPSTLSFSLSSETTQAEIDRAAEVVVETAALLRKLWREE